MRSPAERAFQWGFMFSLSAEFSGVVQFAKVYRPSVVSSLRQPVLGTLDGNPRVLSTIVGFSETSQCHSLRVG